MADQKKQINVELRDEQAEGIYANFAAITHSPAEFVMDFIRVLPGTKKSRVHARLVMAPQNVKAFVRALQDNIAKYEERHGEIKSSGQTPPEADRVSVELGERLVISCPGHVPVVATATPGRKT
jgi:hypothetical protein